jgi:RNA polymerase sigma-70 factor (sigma-E family)
MIGDQAAEGGMLVSWRSARRTVPSDQGHPFDILYQSQRLAMVRLAAFLVDDVHLAEDIVQDAFVGMHAHWRRLRDESSAEGYLRRAVVNRSRSQLRRRRTARRYQWPAAAEEPGADADVLAADEHDRLRHAVRQLPRRQREVLVLRYWADLSEAEIADAMGVSPGTVKSTASRAVRALESVLASS